MTNHEKQTIEQIYFCIQKISMLLQEYKIARAFTANDAKEIADKLNDKGTEILQNLTTLSKAAAN